MNATRFTSILFENKYYNSNPRDVGTGCVFDIFEGFECIESKC